MRDDELDLSDLIEDEPTPEESAGEMHYPERIFVRNEYAKGKRTSEEDVEYIRADAIREGFTKQIWREAVRYARRTAGQPTAALKRARDLIEQGRS